MFPRMLIALLVPALLPPAGRAAEPLAAKYLLEGHLTEGEKALQDHLRKEAKDDQARFGLGVVQFLRAFERAGGSLYKHGLRTEQAFGGLPEPVRDLLRQNPKPEKLTYRGFREIIQSWMDDLGKAEATLAEIKGDDVKLPLRPGLIKFDPLGQGKPVSAAFLLGQLDAGVSPMDVEKFEVAFDRGDVCWLRGYCHFLAAWGELLLAVDGQEMFDHTAHLFFEKVESPYGFLQEERRDLGDVAELDARRISDVIALIHLMTRLPVKEPERMKAALGHLES